MGEYQIRVIRSSGEITAYSCQAPSAVAAVRRAKSIAKACDVVEVWLGMDCIFSDDAHIVEKIQNAR